MKVVIVKVVSVSGAVCALALTLAACGGHPAATPGRAADASGSAAAVSGGSGPAAPGPAVANAAPVRQVNGKPAWAPNRKHSAEENAQYQFGKNGADFGARSEDDYVTRVHAFIDNPPAGAETLNRKNGDRLIYDAHSNTFAVVTKDGAPRTMFKPRDGAAYWAQQKDQATRSTARASDNSEG